MTAIRTLGLALAAAALTALAGCGGDDNDNTPVTPAVTAEVPATASASVEGFIAYLQALVVSSADTLQPVDVSTVTPPTSETAEPVPVN